MGQGGGDDAEKEVGNVVCAGDQMERRQGEEVSRRIQAVAHGWGWKEQWHGNNSIRRDQQASGQSRKIGGMDNSWHGW